MAAVTRLGPGGTPIASLSVANGVVEAVLGTTESADAASFAAQVSITATLNVSPFGSTADSDQITADNTSHTADETGFDNSRGEQADTAAFTANVGVVVQPTISAVGGGRRRRRSIFPAVPDRPYWRDGDAGGVVLVAVVGLVPGHASGDALVASISVAAVANATLSPGGATGNALATGSEISALASIKVGHASVSVATNPAALTIQASVNSGTAKGFDAVRYDNDLVTLLAA